MRKDRSSGNFNVEIFAPGSTKTTTDRGGEDEQPVIDLSSQVQAGGKKVSKATLQRRLKQIEEDKKKAAKDNERKQSTENKEERKPLFARAQNTTFFN